MLRWTWRFLLQSLVPSGRGRGPMAVGRLRNILFIWPDAAVGKNGDFSTNLGRKHPALNSTKHRRWTAIQERERKRDLAWDVLSSVGAFMHGKSMSMGSLFSCVLCLYHLLSYAVISCEAWFDRTKTCKTCEMNIFLLSNASRSVWYTIIISHLCQ